MKIKTPESQHSAAAHRYDYKKTHGIIGFSKNGHTAFQRGEKPKWMWPVGSDIEPTEVHHVKYKHSGLVLEMFYKLKSPNVQSQATGANERLNHEKTIPRLAP